MVKQLDRGEGVFLGAKYGIMISMPLIYELAAKLKPQLMLLFSNCLMIRSEVITSHYQG